MKKLRYLLPLAAFFLFTTAALAEQAKGTIESLNAEEGQLVLNNGVTYSIGENVSTNGLEEGTEVLINFEMEDGERVIQSIRPAAAAPSPGGEGGSQD